MTAWLLRPAGGASRSIGLSAPLPTPMRVLPPVPGTSSPRRTELARPCPRTRVRCHPPRRKLRHRRPAESCRPMKSRFRLPCAERIRPAESLPRKRRGESDARPTPASRKNGRRHPRHSPALPDMPPGRTAADCLPVVLRMEAGSRGEAASSARQSTGTVAPGTTGLPGPPPHRPRCPVEGRTS